MFLKRKNNFLTFLKLKKCFTSSCCLPASKLILIQNERSREEDAEPVHRSHAACKFIAFETLSMKKSQVNFHNVGTYF
jgi:hypothetical protein